MTTVEPGSTVAARNVRSVLAVASGMILIRDLDARADRTLLRHYDSGRLVRIHPRQEPGGQSTDPVDIPTGKAGYALRDLDLLVATAASHGPGIGVYAAQILDDPRPWARMRAVYRLLGPVRRYGADPVEMACTRALELDVISVMKIESMLQRATENTIRLLPGRGGAATARFTRDPVEYATPPASSGTSLSTDGIPSASGRTTTARPRTTQLTVNPGCLAPTTTTVPDAEMETPS